MVAYKTKTFNITTTPNVNPGQNIETVLEPGAVILGVVLTAQTLVAGQNAKFALYSEIAGIPTAIANGDCTGTTNAVQIWAGAAGQRSNDLVKAGPAADTVRGFIPMGMRARWTDGFNNATAELKLQIITVDGGQVQIYYTTEPPTDSGYPI